MRSLLLLRWFLMMMRLTDRWSCCPTTMMMAHCSWHLVF